MKRRKRNMRQKGRMYMHKFTEIWIDAIDFGAKGGWKEDTQFVHLMGSGYLIAADHPGVPVEDATTTVNIPEGGMYRIERDNDERIAIFCHNGFGTAWIGHLIGLAPGLSFFSLLLNTSSITTIEFNREFDHDYTRPELRHMGEIHHLYTAGLPLQRNK